MSRPKTLFRSTRRKIDYGEGMLVDLVPEDADLALDLCEIIQIWRTMFAEEPPSRQDIRATLQSLSKITDGEAREAICTLHSQPETFLIQAAWRGWRKSHHEAPFPVNLLDPHTWPPELIRVSAKAALTSIPEALGRTSYRDMRSQFAVVLVRYWCTLGKKPTVTVESELARESEFLSWSWEMFQRVNHGIDAATLAKILRLATRQNRS